MSFLSLLKETWDAGEIPEKINTIFLELYESYGDSMRSQGRKMSDFDPLFVTLLTLVKKELKKPHSFETYHKRVTQPFDYFSFGIEYIRPLFDKKRSYVLSLDPIEKIEKQLQQGENVILFGNHQTEVDPQLISLVLEDSHPQLAAEIIFIAGDRVITDPMAIPFSLGRNLLCIYSKRHIDTPPEKKEEKLKHNQKTMQLMKELLCEGGKCIYVAPSGGRDRPNQKGEVLVTPFDPQSIEMFRLMAKQSSKPVHFYPLSLVTSALFPPPSLVESEVGEKREANFERALFAFGEEIDMETFPGSDLSDRHAKRSARADYICNLVKANYSLLKQKT